MLLLDIELLLLFLKFRKELHHSVPLLANPSTVMETYYLQSGLQHNWDTG
jgi:hypothetical protein